MDEKVLITKSSMDDIGDAIRDRNGLLTKYLPSEMPEAIETIPNNYTLADEGKVVKNSDLVAQTARTPAITENGTYDTTGNNSVTVNVPSGAAPVLQSKTVTENGDYYPPSGVDGFSEIHVNVQGGGGSAVVQPLSATQNGTYNPPSGVDGFAPVIVNVSGGGGSIAAFVHVLYNVGATCTATDGEQTLTAPDTSGNWICELPSTGTWTFTAVMGKLSNSTISTVEYATSITVKTYFHVDTGYTEVEYIEVQAAIGPYIDTGVLQTKTTFFEIDVQPITGVYGFFYGSVAGSFTEIEATESKYTVYIGGVSKTISHGMARHTIKAYENILSLDGETVKNNVSWVNTMNRIFLFARSQGQGTDVNSYARGIRIYKLTMWNGSDLVREFYPCYRQSDNAPGLFDSVNRVFYPNQGTGSFVLGPAV